MQWPLWCLPTTALSRSAEKRRRFKLKWFPDAVELKNQHLTAVIILSEGANLMSLKRKSTEILRAPTDEAAYLKRKVLFGTPVLFPPNRIEDGTFTFNRTTYQLTLNEPELNNHIHGFVSERPFRIKSQSESSLTVVFDSEDHPDISKGFPHHFQVELDFELKGESLIKRCRIRNLSDSEMPAGFGWHTSFIFDATTDVFQVSVNEQWELNERNLPTGQRSIAHLPVSLEGVLLDDAFTDNGGRMASIVRPKDQIRIDYQISDNVTNWVIFHEEKGFICPEPYTWVTNAPHLQDDPASGFRSIAPGEILNIEATIDIKLLEEEVK
ncbi:aldose 1-epimerase [Jeotgalibacillus sp. JSM ZJ347]|uniref:aldose 1-epimerase n=1 Tax=Jeotgalibacillus sp. JSM ZJ347 TaxID=3342117 RepID=UPI0035A8F6BF